jgi:DNA modification methylase
MSSRRTAGKEALEPVASGDPELKAVLVRALEASDEVDRWTHGFHTYPAGLHPDAASLLLDVLPGERVLDPFCGGGTVLVEGRAKGRTTIGRDVSPTALRVAWLRSNAPSEEALTRFRSASRRLTAAAREAKEFPPPQIMRAVEEWYAPHALWEIESLRAGIAESPEEIRGWLRGCLSSILIKTSWRRSDTSAQREKHHRPAGTTAILFHKKCREWARRAASLREAIPESTPVSDIRPGDARSFDVDPVDLVLTSPPYPSTYDYLPMQHLRHVWFGNRPRQEREIGPRRAWRVGGAAARRVWLDDTHAWTSNMGRMLRPGGHLCIVIGDGLTPSGSVDTSGPTEEAAAAAGLTTVARASVGRPDHGRDAVRWEHIFLYKKPE